MARVRPGAGQRPVQRLTVHMSLTLSLNMGCFILIRLMRLQRLGWSLANFRPEPLVLFTYAHLIIGRYTYIVHRNKRCIGRGNIGIQRFPKQCSKVLKM